MQIKKKYIYIALGLWALVTVTYFTLCKIASDQAMLIFKIQQKDAVGYF